MSSPVWKRRRHASRVRQARRGIVREFERAAREGRAPRFRVRGPSQGPWYRVQITGAAFFPWADED